MSTSSEQRSVDGLLSMQDSGGGASTGNSGRRTIYQAAYSASFHIAQLAVIALLILGPNIGYVLIVTNSKYSSTTKNAVVLLITLFKVGLTTSIIPALSDRMIKKAYTSDRMRELQVAEPERFQFHGKIAAANALTAVSQILAPALVVVLIDARCLGSASWIPWAEPNVVKTTTSVIHPLT